jgi:hypothetical protein
VAFDGQTPDEKYSRTEDVFVFDLLAARTKAQEERMKASRAAACAVCFRGTDSRALQLQYP